LEPEDEEDPEAYLMECWPDDPADIGLESVLKTIGPLFEQRIYQVQMLAFATLQGPGPWIEGYPTPLAQFLSGLFAFWASSCMV